MDWQTVWRDEKRMVAICGAAALGFLALFLPWYGVSITLFGASFSYSSNGFGSSISAGSGASNTVSWLPFNWLFIVGLALVGAAAYQLAQSTRQPGRAGGQWRGLLGAGAVLELVGVLGYIIAAPGALGQFSAAGTVGFGAILGILAALGAGTCVGWDRLTAEYAKMMAGQSGGGSPPPANH